jgi:hypothetical protein
MTLTYPDVRTVAARLLAMAPTCHPLLELPGPEDVAAMVGAKGETWTQAWLRQIWAAHDAEVARRDPQQNPKWDGLADCWIPPDWWQVVRELEDCRLLYIGGGKRASKTHCAAWLCLHSWFAYPGGVRWCIAGSQTTSKVVQQAWLWHYLPRGAKEKLNLKESAQFKIKYQEGRGFTDDLLVLPTKPATTVKFLTVNQAVENNQGIKLGSATETLKAMPIPGGEMARLPNIGAWIDEDVSMDWLNTTLKRCEDNAAKVLWSFSPLKGVTQAVRETLGVTPRLLSSLPAEMLPADRRHVKELPDLPLGHMPYRLECTRPNSRAIFFFKDRSPWSNYALFKKEAVRLSTEEIQREAYGWCRDIRGRRFPKFGPAHLLRPEELPAIGTNYRLVDPHPGRMWATIWVRVWHTAGRRVKRVIYRDWPDVPRFGEWAVPTSRAEGSETKKGADGDAGPAQDGRGYGIADYKRAFLDAEAVRFDLEGGRLMERDPYRLALAIAALAKVGLQADSQGRWTQGQIEDFRAKHPEPVREVIFQSFFDPRAMANPQAAEKGGTTLQDLMLAEQRNEATGRVIGPSMLFEGAFTGKGIDDGVDMVNDQLAWDEQHPDGLIRDYNDPRLYVADTCAQVRWMFEHYTGLGGAEGACKEWADLVRYLCQTDIGHFEPGTLRSRGGGGY